MKKLMMAAAVALTISQAAVADEWAAVKTTADGVLYTSASSINRPDNRMGIYAYPNQNCRIDLKYVDFFPWAKYPDAADWEEVELEVDVNFRIDKQSIWEVNKTSYTSKLMHDDKMTSIVVSSIIDLKAINELNTGNELLFRWKFPSGEWLDTAKYSLDGSAEKLTTLIDACQSLAPTNEWGEVIDEPEADDWS